MTLTDEIKPKIRYIYLPVITGQQNTFRKMCAGACCFAFVYIWHGTDQRILIWTALNFFGVTVENLGFAVTSSKSFQAFQVGGGNGIMTMNSLTSTAVFKYIKNV